MDKYNLKQYEENIQQIDEVLEMYRERNKKLHLKIQRGNPYIYSYTKFKEKVDGIPYYDWKFQRRATKKDYEELFHKRLTWGLMEDLRDTKKEYQERIATIIDLMDIYRDDEEGLNEAIKTVTKLYKKLDQQFERVMREVGKQEERLKKIEESFNDKTVVEKEKDNMEKAMKLLKQNGYDVIKK